MADRADRWRMLVVRRKWGCDPFGKVYRIGFGQPNRRHGSNLYYVAWLDLRNDSAPSRIVWIGLAGGFVGVGVLLGPALRFSSEGNRHPAMGMSILLLSSFIWSAGSLYSRASK